jgi:transcriptional regulator with XRE-family HTH domain
MIDRRRDTLRDRVRSLVRCDGRSQRQIALAAGVQPHRLSEYLTGRRDMYGETLDRLLAALSARAIYQVKRNRYKR